MDDYPTGTPADDYTISLTLTDDDGGGRYEYVFDRGINWDDARLAAEAMSYGVCEAHLVTITSQEEQDLLYGLYGSALPYAWYGGFQEAGIYPADVGWQ